VTATDPSCGLDLTRTWHGTRLDCQLGILTSQRLYTL